MDILVIGNGFDLAHGLPTKYTDFLEFVKVVRQILDLTINGYKKDLDWGNINSKLKSLISEYYQSGDFLQQKEIWLSLLNDNFWIDYFLDNKIHLKDNWIDFESEISKVVQHIDEDMYNEYGEDFYVVYNNDRKPVEIKYNNQIIIKLENTDSYNLLKIMSEACDKLLQDLNKLIRALEIYLADYVGKIKVDVISPDINDFKPTKILSFNYTDTYNKFYKPTNDIQYDFIHGKANKNNTIESNNMVLGIDEYLPEERRNKDVELIAFKKYFQRIHKETGCKYREWVDAILLTYTEHLDKQRKADSRTFDHIEHEGKKMASVIAARMTKNKTCEKHNLYIFGHSLDVTDKDVLRDLILNDNVRTTIYYPTKKDYATKIANLVKVIGQDELIKRTGGRTKTITFKEQQDMVWVGTSNG